MCGFLTSSILIDEVNNYTGVILRIACFDLNCPLFTCLDFWHRLSSIKAFANKTSQYVASWYRPPNGTSEDFQLLRDQLNHIRNEHKGNKLPSVHVLGDLNFKDIDWPERLNKSGAALSESEGKILIDIMNDHGLEQLVHFPTREKNTLDLIFTSLPGQT